jgi:ERAP1-like protein
MLLTDAWASMRVGQINIGDYLTLVNGFHAERDYAVINQLLVHLNYVSQYLINDRDRTAFNGWMRHLFASTVQQVGWEVKPGESDEQLELRGALLHALGSAQDPEARAEAKKLAEQELDHPGSVQKELVVPALEVAAMHGDEALYQKVMARLKAAHDPEQHSLYSQILAEFTDPGLVKQSLNFFISPEVRSQDVSLLLSRELLKPATQPEAWDFIQTHWNDIQGTGGPFSSGRIVQASGRFCTPQLRESMLNFFSEHKVSAQRTLKQSHERIDYCIDLKSQQEALLTSWLERHRSSSGE